MWGVVGRILRVVNLFILKVVKLVVCGVVSARSLVGGMEYVLLVLFDLYTLQTVTTCASERVGPLAVTLISYVIYIIYVTLAFWGCGRALVVGTLCRRLDLCGTFLYICSFSLFFVRLVVDVHGGSLLLVTFSLRGFLGLSHISFSVLVYVGARFSVF